jgi:predicted dehydrogenase
MLHFGLVGYGTHARWAVQKAINEGSKHGRIVAVAEILPENLAQLADPTIAKYGNHREMLAREKLDAVYVATGPEAHAVPTIDALEAGLHVLCEKPMAANAADCARMVAAAKKANKLLVIDFENRLIPHRRKVKEWIAAGYLGQVRAIHWQQMWDGHKVFGPIGARRARLTNASGSLDCSIHELDMARYFVGGGEWREIQAMGMWFGEKLDKSPHISLLAQLSSGVMVTLNSSFAYTAYIKPTAYSDMLTVVGDKGVISYMDDQNGQGEVKLVSEALQESIPFAHVSHVDAIGWVVDEFADVIEGRAALSDKLATGEDGWMAQLITDEANRQCIARRID